MKRILFILMVLFGATPLMAQRVRTTTYAQIEDQHTILETKNDNATIIFPVQPGMVNHQLTYIVGPSVSGITVTVSTETAGTYVTCGSASSTRGGTITCSNVTANTVKVVYSGYAGSGTVDADYYGTTTLAPIASGGVPGGTGPCLNTYVAYFTGATQLGCDSGLTYASSNLTIGPANGTITASTLLTVSSPTLTNSGRWVDINQTATTVELYNGGSFAFSSTNQSSGGADVFLRRDASGTLAQRNGANAQTFNIYNTYTDATHNEYGQLLFSSNVFVIGTNNNNGTGRAIRFAPSGQSPNFWEIGDLSGGSGTKLGPITDNVNAIGDATHRVSNTFSVAVTTDTINGATAGNLTLNPFGSNKAISTTSMGATTFLFAATSGTTGTSLNTGGTWRVTGLDALATTTTFALCKSSDVTGGIVYADTAACLASLAKFKNTIEDLKPQDALDLVLKLQPSKFYWNDGEQGGRQQFGFIADDYTDRYGNHKLGASTINPSLGDYTSGGELHGFQYMQYTAVLTGAIQAEHQRVTDLQAEVERLKSAVQKQN